MTLYAVIGDTEVVEEFLSNHMWSLAQTIAKPHVDIGFSEVDWKQLGMRIGDVHDSHITLHWTIVERFSWILVCQSRCRHQTCGTSQPHQTDKLTSIQ